MTAGGTPILTGGNFETIGPYAGIGDRQPGIQGHGAGQHRSAPRHRLRNRDTDYTYVTIGTPGAAAAVLVADSYGSPGGNTFAVRVLDMSATAPLIDLYLTAPGADLASATPVVSARR